MTPMGVIGTACLLYDAFLTEFLIGHLSLIKGEVMPSAHRYLTSRPLYAPDQPRAPPSRPAGNCIILHAFRVILLEEFLREHFHFGVFPEVRKEVRAPPCLPGAEGDAGALRMGERGVRSEGRGGEGNDGTISPECNGESRGQAEGKPGALFPVSHFVSDVVTKLAPCLPSAHAQVKPPAAQTWGRPPNMADTPLLDSHYYAASLHLHPRCIRVTRCRLTARRTLSCPSVAYTTTPTGWPPPSPPCGLHVDLPLTLSLAREITSLPSPPSPVTHRGIMCIDGFRPYQVDCFKYLVYLSCERLFLIWSGSREGLRVPAPP
ncbi:hypothetical protein E2C01_074193 [Portunus trituberculatus]|uniref:Uncharacterized protein n=1 Tax=Portunus trituberculatus TaxID=210409 RepID=A0A5B7ICL3_PORTR|nr:hypothetical protein [Portunus trituberculatus]